MPYTHTCGKFTKDLYDNGDDGDGDDSDDDDADDGRKWIRIAPHTHILVKSSRPTFQRILRDEEARWALKGLLANQWWDLPVRKVYKLTSLANFLVLPKVTYMFLMS